MSNEKKKSKKVIIIVIIILLVIIAGGVGGYFAYQNIEENKSTGTDWGDTYYSILNSMAEVNQGESDNASLIETDAEDTTVQFIEVEEDEIPYMVVSYTKDDVDKVMICKLNDAEDASSSVSVKFDGANVEYLHNIQLEQDIWYLHFEGSSADTYNPIYTEVKEIEEYNMENGYVESVVEDEETQDVGETYIILKDSETSVETVDGETLSISEYDQTFVEIEVDESSKISLDFDNMSSKEMKTAVTEAVSEYKTNDEIMTEETETIVAEKVEEANTKLAEIQEAEEAVAAKKAEEEAAAQKAAEEEAARLAAEEAAKGLTVGSYTLKYGTYKGEDGATGDILVINSDGSATLTSNWANGIQTMNCTYETKQYNFSQDGSSSDMEYAIVLSGDVSRAYYPIANNVLSDGGTGTYTYSGN